MTKFTPGPWEVARALSGKTFVAIGHNIGMSGKQVCEVLPDIESGSCEANARLIAVSPKLLAYAEQVLSWLEHDGRGNSPLANNARVLIAEATGETQKA